MLQQIYFVGTKAEIEHHAAPLNGCVEYQLIAAEDIVATANAGDLAIFYSEHFDRFREAIQGLKAKQVATLYMLDGILEWRNAWENRDDEPASPFTMRPVLSDKIAAIGPSQARLLAGWGNASRIEIVGVPRFDRYQLMQKRDSRSGKFRLLVTTAKCPSYTPAQKQTIIGSLTDLKDHLDRSNRDVEVVWRLTGELERELRVNNELNDLTGVELAQVLQTVDAVVSTPSTVVLESMLLNLPTAILDYTNSPEYVRTAWRITAPDHIACQLEQLRCAEPSRLQFQQQILADELYLELSATTRMSALVTAMLATARECLEEGRRLQFPSVLLPVPTYAGVATVGIENRDLYPEFEEFHERETSILQAEWAHSRREIKHLQRQIEQLQAELGDAHQIFDQIQEHPIAGPIVRTRERMLRWMKKFNSPKPSPHKHPPLS